MAYAVQNARGETVAFLSPVGGGKCCPLFECNTVVVVIATAIFSIATAVFSILAAISPSRTTVPYGQVWSISDNMRLIYIPTAIFCGLWALIIPLCCCRAVRNGSPRCLLGE